MTQPDLLAQIRSGTAPRNLREFAAQGLLPLPEADLILAQLVVQADPDPGIAKTAKDSLGKVSEAVWARLVEKRNPDPQVVEYCLSQQSVSTTIKEKILLNHSIPDDVFRRLAVLEKGHLMDLIINNQVRLLRDPEILAGLERNPALSIDQKRRIEEFRTEFIFKKQKKEERPAVPVATLEEIIQEIPNLDDEARRIIAQVDAEEAMPPSDEEVQESFGKMFSSDELSHLPEEIVSTYMKILKMTNAQKLRVALLGSREERALLIRDKSRQVSSMVLRSPKLTESEVESFSQMRSLDSELLRHMGQSREFVKRYSIVHNLVRNPKTPSPISLNLLKLLRTMDLRNLERDKNIPEVIRRQARKIRDMKEVHKH